VTVLQWVFDLKKKTDMPKWGSVRSEEVPQYNVWHFVVTQALTNVLGHCLAGEMILQPPTF
jgi:hypothetical protein